MFKCVEELQHEINELKRKLSFVLNENQMLKVKFRKLETDTQNKDKKIQYLLNPKKSYEMRRIFSENGSAIIFNLQKRNKELEEIIAQKDALNKKYHNEARTTRLYSHRLQVEGCRNGARVALLRSSQSPLVSRIEVNDRNLAKTSLQNHSSWASTHKRNGEENSDDTTYLSIGAKVANDPFLRRIFTSHNSKIESRENQDPKKLLAIIWNLKEIVQSFRQRELDARKSLRLKNLELENLTAELKGVRSRLNRQNRKLITNDRRSSSTGCLPQKNKCPSGSLLTLRNSRLKKPGETQHYHRHIDNQLPRRQRSVPYNAVACNGNVKLEWQKWSKTFKAHQVSLEAVIEQSEDILADIAPRREFQYHLRESKSVGQDSSSPMQGSVMKTDIQSKQEHSKTKIEYSIDSEVSSDGEEVYIKPNAQCQDTFTSS